MTNTNLMQAETLKTFLDEKLKGKYETFVTQDRWNVSFGGIRNCVIVKRTGMFGVAVSPDQKNQKVEVFGCSPNKAVDHIFRQSFGFIGKLLLSFGWKDMEKEIEALIPSDVLATE